MLCPQTSGNCILNRVRRLRMRYLSSKAAPLPTGAARGISRIVPHSLAQRPSVCFTRTTLALESRSSASTWCVCLNMRAGLCTVLIVPDIWRYELGQPGSTRRIHFLRLWRGHQRRPNYFPREVCRGKTNCSVHQGVPCIPGRHAGQSHEYFLRQYTGIIDDSHLWQRHNFLRDEAF